MKIVCVGELNTSYFDFIKEKLTLMIGNVKPTILVFLKVLEDGCDHSLTSFIEFVKEQTLNDINVVVMTKSKLLKFCHIHTYDDTTVKNINHPKTKTKITLGFLVDRSLSDVLKSEKRKITQENIDIIFSMKKTEGKNVICSEENSSSYFVKPISLISSVMIIDVEDIKEEINLTFKEEILLESNLEEFKRSEIIKPF